MQSETRHPLLKTLDEQLALHDVSLADLGEPHVDCIDELYWSSEARRISCSLAPKSNGNGASTALDSYRIELDLPFAVGDPMRLACSCPQSQQGRLRCEHTWAALKRLLAILQSSGESPLVEDMFRLEEAPAYTHTLAALDEFLDRQNAEELGTTPAQRLVWRVKLTRHGLDLAAWEQRLSKQSGLWTAGRRVGWERLRTTPELWTCEADRQAALAVREHVESSEDDTPMWLWEIDAFAGVRALSGHPLVFDADEPNRPVRVEAVDLSLSVAMVEGGLVLDAALGGMPLRSFLPGTLQTDLLERGVVGWIGGVGGNGHPAPSRLLIATADPRVLHFVRALDGQPRVIPPDGQDELMRRLARLETLLPVELPSGLIGEEVPADPRIWLRMAPLEPNGLMAQLRVRPAPEGHPCQPGEGSLRLTGVVAGRRVAVERDLDAERLAGRYISAELGLDEHEEERPWQWRMPDDDAALDLISTAQDRAGGDLVVEWPLGGQRKVVTKLEPASLRVEVESRGDWFNLKGNAEVDGWRIALLALMKTLRRGRRYVRLDKEGQVWAEITERFRDRLTAIDDAAHVQNGRIELDATAAPLLHRLTEDDVYIAKASRRFWQLTQKLEELENLDSEPPEGLNATLRSYQVEGYHWMRRLAAWGVGGCLADDMGLGKTIQTLAVLLSRAQEGPALVVAPTSLGFNWQREAQRFTPDLEVILFRESKREKVARELAGARGRGKVVVLSYGLVVRELERLGKIRWATLVLDEAQAIKNSHTKTSQAIRKIEAKWRLALTGTPIENHLGELWSLFRTLSPGLFGSWKRFRERFATPIEKENDAERRGALSRMVRPFILRRTKKEVLSELPPRTEAHLYAELSPVERELYEDVRLKALIQLADASPENAASHRFEVLAALTRLRQLACHPALADARWQGSSAKLDLFLQVVDELRDGGHRALVFSQFTQHLELLRRCLEERQVSYQYLDGQTPVKERGRRVDAFQAGEGEIFLISLMAGGVGLNLTAADYVIHMDPWWNPAIEDQATDRAHRMGQTRPVTVYRLVSRGTIEEEILRLHADKRDLVAGVLEGTDRAAQLGTEELVELIQSGGEDEDDATD